MQYGSITDRADKGLSIVRLPIFSGWEDANAMVANCSPDIPVQAYLLPASAIGVNGVLVAPDIALCGPLALGQFNI